MSKEGRPDVPELEILSVIGFYGSVYAGLKVHPDREHFIYPLGNTVIVEHITSHRQYFLTGHTNDVSCIAVSNSGKYLASGQITHMGFKADVIIWDYSNKELYCRLTLHKVKVQSLAFSPKDTFLVSLGGQDDGSIVVWDVKSKEAVCGAPAAVKSAGTTYCVAYCNNDDFKFVSGGDGTIRVWTLDLKNRKIPAVDCNMGQLKRIVKCIEVAEDDSYFYCGTTSGDVLKMNIKNHILSFFGPEKDKFSMGVTSLALVKTGAILIGGGDGTVAICKGDKFKRMKSAKVKGASAITSLALRGNGHQFFVGAANSQVYLFNFAEFTHEILSTCHAAAVNDIVFPAESSELFATCSRNDIRIWNAGTGKELLRISVPNMTCHAIDFMRNGKCIVSAWDDNKLRAFFPESGKLMYMIEDAHNKEVTAIATTSDCKRIISGGGEGQVRVWEVSRNRQSLVEAMKEHKGAVSCIKVRKNDQECISASEDGTCIIWDLQRFVRNQVIFANTLFKCVCYHPDEHQVITSGTDRKIGYWETYNAAAIREVDGSMSGSINGMDMAPDGQCFVTGGDDKLIKVWNYKEGKVTSIGKGHSGFINRLRVCPQQKLIVSVSKDGAIICWKYPVC
ncbi:hypothetical protein BSL78_09070 [Apostichopus japonicus]|uniref:Cilia- and flagella-associated protein 52 n=1 Tax=Stichopus japonicus TaxID=307972 RepID=A0A2G8L1B9_STIJA|nr:hypothetical protein BSL78_09070 [Apostichopus japonicus]